MSTILQQAIHGNRFRERESWPVRRIEACCDRMSEIDNTRLIAIGQLTACVAHDLKNFCFQAKGILYMIMRRLEDQACESIRNHVALLGSAIDNIITLSENVLNFGQGKKVASDTKRSLTEYVEELIATVKFGSSEIPLSVHPSMKEVKVDMSRFELHQILLNFIQNARDASGEDGGESGVQISVVVHPMQRTGDRSLLHHVGDQVFVGVSVCDNGQGMNEAVLSQVATPFFTTKKTNGNGLGLFMSTQISDLYGGAVLVRSKVHEGTQITLCLPCTVS